MTVVSVMPLGPSAVKLNGSSGKLSELPVAFQSRCAGGRSGVTVTAMALQTKSAAVKATTAGAAARRAMPVTGRASCAACPQAVCESRLPDLHWLSKPHALVVYGACRRAAAKMPWRVRPLAFRLLSRRS